MTAHSDRRDSWRAVAQVSLRKPGERWGQEAAGDVSLGGARAVFSKLPPATRVEVKVRMRQREVRALGDVVRVSAAPGGLKNAHIRFASLSDSDQMAVARYLDDLRVPAPVDLPPAAVARPAL